MTLLNFIESVYFIQNRRIRKEQTRKQYRIVVAQFEQSLGRVPAPNDLTDENLAHAELFWSDRVSPHTVEQRMHYMLALARWCCQHGQLKQWPTIRPPRPPRRNPEAWSLPSVRAILAACDGMQGAYAGVPAALWWKAVHGWWWDTGERKGATLQLRWEHVDLTNQRAHVPAEIRKFERDDMIYRLKESTVQAIKSIRDPSRDLVFPWDRSDSLFYRHYAKLVRLAGLPRQRRCGPQKMRRSVASFLEAAGQDATRALGHSSRRVTTEFYIDKTIASAWDWNSYLPEL